GSEELELILRGAGDKGAETDRINDEIPRFSPVDRLQLGEGKSAVLALNVQHLSPDHPLRSEAPGTLLDQGEGGLRREFRLPGRPRQETKGLGEKRISGQNGHRLAEHLVIGRLAAAKIVVVHGGKVVMDQGI